jgi:hypothetical protein
MTAHERYLAAYAERFGRAPRRTPEFAEPRPCRVSPSPAGPRTTPAVDR